MNSSLPTPLSRSQYASRCLLAPRFRHYPDILFACVRRSFAAREETALWT